MDDHHFRWARSFSRMVLSWFDLPIEIRGKNQVSELAPGAVVVVNGGSLLELVAVWASFPQLVRFVLPPDCFEKAIIGSLLRQMGNIPLIAGRDGRSLVRQARGLFRHGGHIGVFCQDPDAGLDSPSLQLAARVAWRTRCPVVPVALFGASEILPRGSWLPLGGTLRICIGAPQKWPSESIGRPGAEIRRLVELIKTSLLNLVDPLLEPLQMPTPAVSSLPPFPPP